MSRTQLAVVILLFLAPIAAAQALPLPTLTPPATAPTAPSAPSSPSVPPLPEEEAPTQELPGSDLTIDEELFSFHGTLLEPRLILIRDLEGGPAFSYSVDEGRATIAAGDVVLLTDATLLRIDGDPLGDAFTLTLRDAEGQEHEVKVDRAALQSQAPLPEGAPIPEDLLEAPPIEVLRPLEWPDAPTESYLLYVEDPARNRLAAASLDGTPYLQRSGAHAALVQVPLAELRWDRVLLKANEAGSSVSENVTFVRIRDTETAAIFHTHYHLEDLGLADGDVVQLRLIYERRLTPFVAERIPEDAVYEARLDGLPPTVTMQAPATSQSIHVPLTWSGSDAHSGLGGFNVQYRVAGTPSWTSWLAPTSRTSATFSGEWGRTYEFRTFALDKVGLPSPIPATATTRIAALSEAPAGADPVNEAPTVRLTSPRAGQVLAGVVTVAWDARDPDATPVTSRLQVSEDDGVNWRTLFAGEGASYAWNTGSEADGSGYRLRLTVSDGTLSESDTVSSLSVKNVAAPPEAPDPIPETPTPSPPSVPTAPPTRPAPPPAANDASETPAEDEPPATEDAAEKGTPMPSVAVTVIALALVALVASRRR